MWKGRIDLWDAAVLGGVFAAYLWRVSCLPKEVNDDDDEGGEVGPAVALTELPKRRQWAVMAALTIAALIILVVAEPFAGSLVKAGGVLGIDRFLLVQWVAPLAGEAPEVIICVLFTLALRPTAALGALISDKINQWTLLVGMLPLFFSLGAHRVLPLPLDARQHEEFFLTAAQSVFAVALLFRRRLPLTGALALLRLFAVQLGLAFAYQRYEARVIAHLTGMAWLYLILAAGLLVWSRAGLAALVKVGLLGRYPTEVLPVPIAEGPADNEPLVGGKSFADSPRIASARMRCTRMHCNSPLPAEGQWVSRRTVS